MVDMLLHYKHPFRSLITGVEGDVLWVLARARISLTASEISRAANRSKSQVQNVLVRLHAVKIIDRQLCDGWSWNCLNDSHPYAPHLRAMATEVFDVDNVPLPQQARAPDIWSVS